MDVVLYGPKNPETIRFLMQLNAHEKQAGKELTVLVGFLHSDPNLKGTTFYDYPIFGDYNEVPALAAKGAKFVSLVTGSTIGRYHTARAIVERGGNLASIIHPSVDLLFSEVGKGAYIQEGVVLQAGVVLGTNCSIHMGCLIAHEVKIGNSAFVSFAVAVAGEVEIGDGAFIGANATVLPQKRIGKFATIGAGAVVNKDVPDYAVAVGNPARIIGENPRELNHGDVFRPQDATV